MSTFSGQDIVAQERCKIVYATFVDYIIKCYDSTKRIVYIYNPNWWTTTYDDSTKTLTNIDFEIKGISFKDSSYNTPLIAGVLEKGITGLAVKLKAEDYVKWRMYPISTLPVCLGDQSWLYGLIPYNLFCTQFVDSRDFYLLKANPAVSNLQKVNGNLVFDLAPLTNFVDPQESLTEPMTITFSPVGIDDLPITNFSIISLDGLTYIQTNEIIKYFIVIETEFYSEQLEGQKFYLYNCFDTLYGYGIQCISKVTFFDQASNSTITRTAISLKNTLDSVQRYVPIIQNHKLVLQSTDSLEIAFIDSNNDLITDDYLKIIPGDASKFVMLCPDCSLIVVKVPSGDVIIIDPNASTYSCIYGEDLTLTTLNDSYDNIIQQYPIVRYPVFFLPVDTTFPTMQNNLHAWLMIKASNDGYGISGDFLPLYWNETNKNFTASSKFFPSYKLLNQVIETTTDSFKLVGLDYDRLGVRESIIEYKYYKWDTKLKEFKPGNATEISILMDKYFFTLNLATNICKVRLDVYFNGEFEKSITSMLISYPKCDFPRQYDLDLCDCKPYYCVDLGDTMLMPCEFLSKETTGEVLPFCMGWPGETKIPFKDVVQSTCTEPQVCTIYGCLPPYEYITPCTAATTTISSIPACDWFGPGTSMQYNLPVTKYYLASNGDITGVADGYFYMGKFHRQPRWVICNIYDYLTPNEYTDIDGNSAVVDPMYWIFLKYLSADPLKTFPFTEYEITLGTLTQLLPGIQNVQFSWSDTQACKWMSIIVNHTRDLSYANYVFHPFIYNVNGLENFTCSAIQTAYDAYCDKVKWLVNEDAYAYAVYMGYLDPAVGITV